MSDWYETFFDGVVVDMWLEATPPEATLADADFLIEALALGPGARVLDAPCGHGRHAVALARRGFQMTGVDISEAMIGHARQAATEAGVEIEWHRADMREFPAEKPFDAAYCFGNSFGYLGRAGNRTFLDRVAGALAPGALFALHTGMTAESVLPRLQDRSWAPIGDLLFLEENRYDAARSCLETVYTFVRDGKTESHTARHSIYTVRELCDLFEAAGFEIRSLFRSLACEPFELDSPELLVVAQKI
jgi:cyclopropane fatty-acyl-phospholipid synthase-like methyltransferase